MPKKYTDANGISHYASDGSVVAISKFARGYPKSNGRVFDGKVTSEEVPSKWKRAEILKKYGQQFEVPQHQDLIRLNGSPERTKDIRAGQFEDPIHSPLLVRVD